MWRRVRIRWLMGEMYWTLFYSLRIGLIHPFLIDGNHRSGNQATTIARNISEITKLVGEYVLQCPIQGSSRRIVRQFWFQTLVLFLLLYTTQWENTHAGTKDQVSFDTYIQLK